MNIFLNEVIDGLTKYPKSLPSKYFYDSTGDKLFQEIMNLEEYYLPRLELEIIQNKSDEIANSISSPNKLDIIELGAGDGSKIKFLLKSFTSVFTDIQYIPLDISENILIENKNEVQNFIPELKVSGIAGNYFQTFPKINSNTNKLVLFMGSNIGNFYFNEAVQFVKFISDNLINNDYLLIAFDLKKYPKMILNAYNDSKGVTRKFNINLLERINIELNANFNIDKFEHYPVYDPVTGNTFSYLVSLDNQLVQIANNSFNFHKFETIKTEISKKYSIAEIEDLASSSDLEIINYFFDKNKYYSLVLFQKK